MCGEVSETVLQTVSVRGSIAFTGKGRRCEMQTIPIVAIVRNDEVTERANALGVTLEVWEMIVKFHCLDHERDELAVFDELSTSLN
jgi:hypothetical protein